MAIKNNNLRYWNERRKFRRADQSPPLLALDMGDRSMFLDYLHHGRATAKNVGWFKTGWHFSRIGYAFLKKLKCPVFKKATTT
mmetsp:Transcript_19348/g.41661  ORF Transcript_19348/g.41661 Transcript_19348/m.41661 type:complete len:83 (+) Transcript_19348:48-296(+)